MVNICQHGKRAPEYQDRPDHSKYTCKQCYMKHKIKQLSNWVVMDPKSLEGAKRQIMKSSEWELIGS